MNFTLHHQDSAGKITTSNKNISYLGFVKHLTFAGLKTNNGFPTAKYLSNIFDANNYWCRAPRCFSKYDYLSNDPTETAYTSNKIGKALADYLAKKVYGATFTHCYEDAMAKAHISIRGERPDFYCINVKKKTSFTMEAKGYSRNHVSDEEMQVHKKQSESPHPQLKTPFSVASVAYSLYNKPEVKFYDPILTFDGFDEDLSNHLIDLYIDSVRTITNSSYEIIKPNIHAPELLSEFNCYRISLFTSQATPPPILLVSKKIRDINQMNKKIKIPVMDNEEFYIDNDGVGFAASWAGV